MMEREEQKKQIKELYEQGMSFRKISQIVGVSHPTTVRIIKEMGIYKNNNVTTRDKILNLYKEGKRVIDIAFELGTTRAYVMAVLKDADLLTDKDEEEVKNIVAEDRLANATLERIMIDGIMYTDITPLIFAQG